MLRPPSEKVDHSRNEWQLYKAPEPLVNPKRKLSLHLQLLPVKFGNAPLLPRAKRR
jgi:hypothetical protein